jgi:hypothetical protein
MVGVTPREEGGYRYDAPQEPPARVTVLEELTAEETTPMTDTNEAVITEALSVIDKALAQMLRRELVSSGEVTDVLLDVRTLLTLPAPVEG